MDRRSVPTNFSFILFSLNFSFRWGKRTGHNKAQILYYIAENLELRKSEIANRLKDEANIDLAQAEKQISVAIQRLFHWAAYADKYGGNVQVSFVLELPTAIELSQDMNLTFYAHL